MSKEQEYNWESIGNTPQFRQLHAIKTRFLFGWMAFSVLYYFLLPIGAAYFQDIFKMKISGPLNLGIIFAFSQFFITWGVACHYARYAARVSDKLTQEVVSSLQNEAPRHD